MDRLTNGLKTGFKAELEVNESFKTVNRFFSHQMLSNYRFQVVSLKALFISAESK